VSKKKKQKKKVKPNKTEEKEVSDKPFQPNTDGLKKKTQEEQYKHAKVSFEMHKKIKLNEQYEQVQNLRDELLMSLSNDDKRDSQLTRIDKYNKQLVILKSTLETSEPFQKAQEQKKKVPVKEGSKKNKKRKKNQQNKGNQKKMKVKSDSVNKFVYNQALTKNMTDENDKKSLPEWIPKFESAIIGLDMTEGENLHHFGSL
jgi:hypothetical protein